METSRKNVPCNVALQAPDQTNVVQVRHQDNDRDQKQHLQGWYVQAQHSSESKHRRHCSGSAFNFAPTGEEIEESAGGAAICMHELGGSTVLGPQDFLKYSYQTSG